MSALGDFSLGGITLTPVQDLALVINGADKTGLLMTKSAKITFGLGQRSSFQFVLVDTENTYKPVTGNAVTFYLGEGTIFSGSIERLTRGLLTGTLGNFIQVECVDFAQVLDRRLVAATYETPGQTAGDIVRLIIATYLAEDGITAGDIVDGITIDKAVFPYVTATAAINDLANLAGATWWVDSGKRLNFCERTGSLAPFSISDASQPFKDLKVTPSRERLKNHIWLRAGKARTDLQTERFKGDGETQTFTVEYEIDTEPAVYVALSGSGLFTAKTVGIRGVDTGKDFYWSRESQQVSQERTATPLGATDVLKVVYYGLFPLIMEAYDAGSIIERRLAEGGSGSYEALEEDQDVDDRTLAVEKLGTLLKRFAPLETMVDLTTFARGLAVGQILPISLTDEDLDDDFLITEMTVTPDLSTVGVLMTSEIKCTSGEYLGGWVEFFRALEKQGKKFSIRPDEILGLGPTKFDGAQLTDTYNTTDPLDDGSGDPYTGVIIWGSGDDDENKYAIGTAKVGG